MTGSAFHSTTILNSLIGITVGIILAFLVVILPILSLVFLSALIGFLLIFTYPMRACYLLIVIIIFTSAMPRGTLIPLLAPNEVMLAVTFVIVFLNAIITAHDKSFPPAMLFSGLVLVVGTSIIPIGSYMLRGISIDISDMLKIIAPAQYLLLFWVFMSAPRSDEDRNNILQVMFLCATMVCIIGLLQAANVDFVTSFLLDIYPSGHTEVASEAGRITSILGSWNTLGTFLMINILTLVALQNEQFSRLNKVNMFVSAILSLLTLLGSGSYASLAGLIVGFICIKIIDPRGLRALVPLFLAMAIGVIILLPLITTRFLYQYDGVSNDGLIPNTLTYRVKVWTEIYLPLIAQNPLWGVSPTFKNLWFQFAESQYLMLLYQSGAVSLVAFIIWVYSNLQWLLKVIRHNVSTIKMLSVVVFITLILLLVMGITNPVFTYSGVMDYLWIFLGIIASSQKDKLHVTY